MAGSRAGAASSKPTRPGRPPASRPSANTLGDVVLVSGELGAGKTTLIRGAARGLGVTEPVTSPTFTIGQTYSGRVPVSHVDLYRLADLGQEDPALLDDYVTPQAVAFIEWPGAAEPWLERITRRVELRHLGGDTREITY